MFIVFWGLRKYNSFVSFSLMAIQVVSHAKRLCDSKKLFFYSIALLRWKFLKLWYANECCVYNRVFVDQLTHFMMNWDKKDMLIKVLLKGFCKKVLMQKIYNCFSSIFRSDNRLFRESIDPLCAALGIIHFFNFFSVWQIVI